MSEPLGDENDSLIMEISNLTSNMSLVDNSEDESALTDDELIPSTIATPYKSKEITPPPTEERSSDYGQPIEDDQIKEFETIAANIIDAEILNSEPKVTIVLAPSGDKHVYSRTWVPKSTLSSVVERPERLRASCLGIGLAKTKVPLKVLKSARRTSLYSPHFELVHGKDWATELYSLCNIAGAKLEHEELEVPESWPSYDIYLAPQTIEALEGNIGAIELAIDQIYSGPIKRAFVAVRPPGHHCNENEPSGFCIINNAHIAIQYARATYGISHAVILDFDLHHGDGSQDLLWKLGFMSDGTAEIPMGYFSIHDINSFPCEQGFVQPHQLSNASVCFVAHNAAIWNVHLKHYESEEAFSKLYETDYSVLFSKAVEFLDQSKSKLQGKAFRPLIVISAGFDGSEFESPGMQRHNVHVPTSFYNKFTRDSIELAEKYGDGQVLSLLEGGYSSPALATGIFSHLTGMAGKEYDSNWCPTPTTPNEINMGMRQRWKAHPEKWATNGIHLGRSLFSNQPEPPNSKPSSASSPQRIKHNLRKKRHNWSV